MPLNPYESPTIIHESSPATSPQWLQTCARFIATGTLASALLGMGTTVWLAWDSPEYFTTVMRWSPNDLWIKAVLKGALEGAVYGFLLSGIFIIAAGRITHRQIAYWSATEKLLWVAIGAVSMSGMAGVIASMCADGMPDPMRELFPLAPAEPRRFFRFVFVSVSINVLPWSAPLFVAVHLGNLYREELRKRTNQPASTDRAGPD